MADHSGAGMMISWLSIETDSLFLVSKGEAYVETAAIWGGIEYAAAITVDHRQRSTGTCSARRPSPYLYVYAWQQGALRKLWQSPLVEGGLGWEIFAGTGADGSQSLSAAPVSRAVMFSTATARVPGKKKIIAGSGGEYWLWPTWTGTEEGK